MVSPDIGRQRLEPLVHAMGGLLGQPLEDDAALSPEQRISSGAEKAESDDLLELTARFLSSQSGGQTEHDIQSFLSANGHDLTMPMTRAVVQRAQLERCSAILGAKPLAYRSHSDVSVVRHLLASQEQPILDVEQWQERRRHIIHNMQVVMGWFPSTGAKARELHAPVPFDILSQNVPTTPDCVCKVVMQKIRFCPEEQDQVEGWLLIPQVSSPCPAVLCPHQTTMNPQTGKDEPAGLGGSRELCYALELAQLGYVTLTIDYPGFGGYSFPVYQRGYASVTMKGIWNHLRAVDLLVGLPQVDSERIGALGHSLGGHNSLFLAVFDPRIKVIGTSCGFTSFARYAETVPQKDLSVWAWPEKYMPRISTHFHKDPACMPFEFHEVLAACAPRHIFCNAPLGDENFDVQGVRACVQAAGSIYKLLGSPPDSIELHTPNVGHDFPKEVRRLCYAFFGKQLKI
ncbi:unnamed protein product [Durusdinium trenchii]|uniref:(4-O-methyl)-D-glucuronate--lignin esterase n=2 Tax=Durusdinium trenchii TaxID=1381693 RepID=A0ABP0LTS0_9DINO